MPARPFKRYGKRYTGVDHEISLLQLQTYMAVSPCIERPTTDNLKAALGALDRHVIQHNRWIAPYLTEVPTQESTIIMSNQESAYTTGFFRSPTGAMQSIASAVVTGAVQRSHQPGKVVIGAITMSAEAAVAGEHLDQNAAAYVLSREACDKPAAFTREDAQRPPERDTSKTPAQACIEALGAFFTRPGLATQQVAVCALEAHRVASGGIA
jgi:hypothetical protein